MITEEIDHMSSARAFDTLVASNLQLIRTLRATVVLLVACSLLATAMTGLSGFWLRTGQSETHELLRAMGRAECQRGSK